MTGMSSHISSNSGVERLPFRFVTAFVTSRHEFLGSPEERRNEGCGIEPA
jgi:hypothetical protein